MCPVCKSLQNATKSLSVMHAPRILIVTIKRFDVFGRKITKNIQYPPAFNMKEHMGSYVDQCTKMKNESPKKVNDEWYDLYGVVLHKGSSTNSGHYFAYCKSAGNNCWYECNDSFVGQMSEESVLNKEAYLLFYQKRVTKPSAAKPTLSEHHLSVPPSKEVVEEKKKAEVREEKMTDERKSLAISVVQANNENSSATTQGSTATNQSKEKQPLQIKATTKNNVEEMMTDFNVLQHQG